MAKRYTQRTAEAQGVAVWGTWPCLLGSVSGVCISRSLPSKNQETAFRLSLGRTWRRLLIRTCVSFPGWAWCCGSCGSPPASSSCTSHSLTPPETQCSLSLGSAGAEHLARWFQMVTPCMPESASADPEHILGPSGSWSTPVESCLGGDRRLDLTRKSNNTNKKSRQQQKWPQSGRGCGRGLRRN